MTYLLIALAVVNGTLFADVEVRSWRLASPELLARFDAAVVDRSDGETHD
jgi:hypothetical protein